MADQLKRVGLIFKADGAVDFNKSLKEVTASIEENKAAYELVKSTWDESTKTAEKLQEKQKYLAKQVVDYSDKVKMLQGSLKDLEEKEQRNAEKLQEKREQLSAAISTTESYKSKCNILKAELEKLESAEITNEKAIKKKRNELAKAEKNFLDYSKTAEQLEKDIHKLNKGEANNAAAILKKKAEINKTQKTLNNYKKGLQDVEEELESGTAKLKDYTKKLEEFSEKADGVSDSLSGVSTAAAGVLAAAAATVPATEEYRQIMASLEASSELAGYTAEQTAESYGQLFEVLGDDQTAATTTANLQALGLTQEQITKVINGSIGAWAKYGDSIPIDGLAEAINETVKTGQVTGNLADVLNWGTSEEETFGLTMKENIKFTELSSEELEKLTETERQEYEARKQQYETIEAYNQELSEAVSGEDKFNIALQEATTEAERADMIMQMLANQGLMQVGEQWKENNENLIEGRNATAKMQEATAELAETIAPIITKLTTLAADLLGKFNDMPESVQGAIGVMLLLVATSSTLFGTLGNLSMGIKNISQGISSLTAFMGTASGGAKALWSALATNKFALIIAGVTAIITVLITLYDKCEWFRNAVNITFNTIKNAITDVTDTISGVINAIEYMFSQFKNIKIPLPHFKISGEFSLNPLSVPKLGVDWRKDGVILTRPTLFAMNGDRIQGGGEAGHEAVLPIELLKQYIREENDANNRVLVDLIREAMSEVKFMAENTIFIGDKKVETILTEMVLKKISEKMSGSMRAQGVKGWV